MSTRSSSNSQQESRQVSLFLAQMRQAPEWPLLVAYLEQFRLQLPRWRPSESPSSEEWIYASGANKALDDVLIALTGVEPSGR